MFLNRLFYLIEINGITKNKLLNDLSLGKNSFVNWENRGTIPSADTVCKIADYFGVTTDYLLGLTDIPERNIEENPLLVSFNELSDIDKEKVKAYINDLLQAQKYTELVTPYKTNKVREIAAFGGKSTNGTPPKKKPEITW